MNYFKLTYTIAFLFTLMMSQLSAAARPTRLAGFGRGQLFGRGLLNDQRLGVLWKSLYPFYHNEPNARLMKSGLFGPVRLRALSLYRYQLKEFKNNETSCYD